MINVSNYGVKGFYTFKGNINKDFRPCATSINRDEAYFRACNEANEVMGIENTIFPEILNIGKDTTNYILPIHLHPFLWNERLKRDVDWYNKTRVPYIKFLNYKSEKVTYIPRDLSVYNNRDDKTGLSWLQYEGYAYDEKLEDAKIKSIMELIEKDVITLWWHRETKSVNIVIDKNRELRDIEANLKEQGISMKSMELVNDMGVYVVVTILQQKNDYPKVCYGSAAHFNIDEAIKRSIYEAISVIAGERYQFINNKEISEEQRIPEFLENNIEKKLSQYKEIKSLELALNKYNFYYTYSSYGKGYLVKSYCYEMQPVLYKTSVHLTKRFILASDTQVEIKEDFPFI